MHVGKHQLIRQPHSQRQKVVNRYHLIGLQYNSPCVYQKEPIRALSFPLAFEPPSKGVIYFKEEVREAGR